MTLTIIYTCDVCGNHSKDPDKIIECECSHLNITRAELECWKELKNAAESAGRLNSVTHNEITEAGFDSAIKRLIDFEKEHNLQNKRIPDKC